MAHIHTKTASYDLAPLNLPELPRLLADHQPGQAAVLCEKIEADAVLSQSLLKRLQQFSQKPLSGLLTAYLAEGEANFMCMLRCQSLQLALHQRATPWLKHYGPMTETFASCTAMIGQQLNVAPHHHLYTLGYFHNAGLVLLAQHHDNFNKVLKTSYASANDYTLTELHHWGVDHAFVSYRLAQAWQLSPYLASAIRHHHQANQILSDPELSSQVKAYVAVLTLAEYLLAVSAAWADEFTDKQWQRCGAMVQRYLGLQQTQMADLQQQAADLLMD